ncbi:hypothetical protein F4604DRAFT_1127740 [Suillus subluteus]|nr:hypothetical protein F4604DRAFT_1127740 [Suillus subluteus]
MRRHLGWLALRVMTLIERLMMASTTAYTSACSFNSVIRRLLLAILAPPVNSQSFVCHIKMIRSLPLQQRHVLCAALVRPCTEWDTNFNGRISAQVRMRERVRCQS